MHIIMLWGDAMERQLQGNGYTVGFSNKEVTAWGGIALMKQMLDRLQFQESFSQFYEI